MKSLAAIAVLMLLVFSVGCRSFMARNSPDYILKQGEWNTRSTEHFVFYFRPRSRTEQRINTIVDRQEHNYTEILGLLRASDPDLKIKVFIFPTPGDKIRITSSRDFVHTIDNYYTVYCIDRDTLRNVIAKRELTHLLLGKTWGPVADGPFSWIVLEGIAVWSEGRWNHIELFDYLRLYIEKGYMLTPYDIAMHKVSSDRDIVEYPIAGAFVKYLVQQYGLEKLERLYKEGNSQKDFLKIFGMEFSEASQQFMEYIKARYQSHISGRSYVHDSGKFPNKYWLYKSEEIEF